MPPKVKLSSYDKQDIKLEKKQEKERLRNSSLNTIASLKKRSLVNNVKKDDETCNNYYKPAITTQIIYVNEEDHVTSDSLTKYELAMIVGIRAKQIEDDPLVFTDVGELTDSRDIAILELQHKKCPLSICRTITTLPNNTIIVEKKNVNDLLADTDLLSILETSNLL